MIKYIIPRRVAPDYSNSPLQVLLPTRHHSIAAGCAPQNRQLKINVGQLLTQQGGIEATFSSTARPHCFVLYVFTPHASIYSRGARHVRHQMSIRLPPASYIDPWHPSTPKHTPRTSLANISLGLPPTRSRKCHANSPSNRPSHPPPRPSPHRPPPRSPRH